VTVCLIDGRNVVESFWLGMGTGVLAGSLMGCIAAVFLCLPVQVVLDVVGWTIRTHRDAHRNAPGTDEATSQSFPAGFNG
jgi:hypothetical protein